MKLRQQIAVIVSTVAALVPNARSQTFVRIPLHYPVASSFPVDLHSDGQWELAIVTSESPQRFGVYDAHQRRWIDEPRNLSAGSSPWIPYLDPVSGALDYAYGSGDSIRSYSSVTTEDRALWRRPFTNFNQYYFWGRTQSGVPFIIFVEHPSGSRQTIRHFLDLLTGTELTTQEGYFGPPSFVFGYPDSESQLLALPTGYYSGWTGTGISHLDAMQGFDLISVDGIAVQSLTYFLYSGPWEPVDTPPLTFVRIAKDPATEDVYYLVYSVGFSIRWYLSRYVQHTGRWETIKLWKDQTAIGAAPMELLGDGVRAWVIPLAQGGWQRRALYTGEIIDTIPNLPYVDIQQGQIITRDHLTTFFLSDSSLYIFQADVNSGILDDPGSGAADAAIPRLALTAFPNPFNAAVTLSWPAGTDARSLTIYNVLGQEVRSYRLSESNSASSWDGRDMQGRGVASGVYFARLDTRSAARTVKLVLLR